MKLLASEQTSDLVDALRKLLRSHTDDRASDTFFARDHGPAWRDIAAGGWPLLGVPESAGGAGADLRDLADVAGAWGERLLPLPLLYTVVVQRRPGAWRREPQAPFTLPIRGRDGRTRVPFPAMARCASPDLAGELPRERLAEAPQEAFAPSLPVAIIDGLEGCDADARREVAALGAAEAAGIAAVALKRSLEYALQRQAFGQPIGGFQAVKHLLADMHRDVELAQTAVVWACQEDDGHERAVNAAIDLSRKVLARSIQVHGGIGFTWELDLHFLLRHIMELERLLAYPPWKPASSSK